MPRRGPLALGCLLASVGACDRRPSPDDGSVPQPSDADTLTPPGPPANVALSSIQSSVNAQFGTLVSVSWSQVGAGTLHIEYSFDDGIWLSTPRRALTDGDHEEWLLGVPYSTDVRWKLVAEDTAGTTISPEVAILTGQPPAGLPIATVTVENPARWDAAGAPYLFTTLAQPESFGEPWWILIVDRAGRVVWSTRSAPQRVSMHSRVARDGRSLYVDQNSFWAIFDRGDRSEVWQITLDGTVEHVFATPGLHHPFTDLPDGTIAYGAADGFYWTEQLAIVDRSGNIEPRWDCEKWLDSMAVWDFCSANSLTYDEPSDSFLFTFWSIETVVQLDGPSGEPMRWFGHIPGTWTYEPLSSVFWNPHGAVFTDEGTLLLSTDLTTNGVETVVREYQLDETFDELKQVWTFGIGDGIWGVEMGEAIRLPNGNTWHSYGDLPRLREATPDGEVVWDVKWTSTAIGHSSPISDLYALLPDRP